MNPLLGFASDADLNTDHAVTSTHIGIKEEQLEDPRALILAAFIADLGGTVGDGLPYATRAVTIARERGLLSILPMALWAQATSLRDRGHFNLARSATEEGIRLASDFGQNATRLKELVALEDKNQAASLS